MMRMTRGFAKPFARYALIAVTAVVLAGCGGSSGDDDPVVDPNGDDDNDGIINSRDADADGDGLTDLDKVDENNNGINDFDESDFDGDGSEPGNVGSNDELTCSGEGGSDPISRNADWNDNCTLRRGAVHADSYYTRGVQRILVCLGYDLEADAEFGPQTELAVETWQTDQGLTVDGVVGPMSWAALEDSLEEIGNDTQAGVISYGVDSVSCRGQVQFFQNYDPVSGASRGWTIANNPGEATQVEFSVRNPFN